jgi:hypothetical protein
MNERRKTPRKDWIIGKDDRGRSVLEWKLDYRHTKRQEHDPSARTYNFLQKLNVPDLALEEDGRRSRPRGRNPYDSTRAIGEGPRDEQSQKKPDSEGVGFELRAWR